MYTTFIKTLNPMLSLFFCIAIGYLIRKFNIVPDNSSKVLSKLCTWVFFPSLSFVTMAKNCTVDTLSTHAINVLISCIAVTLAICIAIPLSRLFITVECGERGVYKYALAFGNSGYVGDPLVQAMHGDIMLSYYKIYCLPLSIAIYTWGINTLIPNKKSDNILKSIINPPVVALLLGIVCGIIGLFDFLPDVVSTPIISTLESLKACVGPSAMLIAGITIANYDFKEMLSNKKVYIASTLRLLIIPSVIIGIIFGIKELVNYTTGLSIGNTVLFLVFFSVAAPLGLNTVVFPEAYGGNPKTGASMAMISHALSVITIPIMYSIMVVLFGAPHI